MPLEYTPKPKVGHIYQSDSQFVLITQVDPIVKGRFSDKPERTSFDVVEAHNITSSNWNKRHYMDLEAEANPESDAPTDNGNTPEKPEKDDIKELREKLNKLEKEVDDKKKSIEDYEKEKRNLQNELADANDKVNKLEGEKRGLETRFKQVQDENSQLKTKVEALEKEKDGLIMQINQLIDEIARLKEERNDLKKQIDQLINKINQLNKKNDQLKDENVNLRDKIDNLRIRVDDLEFENKRLKGKKLLPIVLSILLGAFALLILFRVLLVSRNSDSELQRKLDEKNAECVELESRNDSICKENNVLLAIKDSLLRVNESIKKSNTQLTSSQQVKFKLDSQPKWVGLWMYANRKENPERKFWIDVKRAICLRSLRLKCNQTGSATIQVYRYEKGQSSLTAEQDIYLKKDVENTVELMDFYFNQVGLYYLIISNNNCGSFVYEKVVDEWEFKQCFSDDLDILGLGETPPKKKDIYSGVFDYGYFTSLQYCRIIE